MPFAKHDGCIWIEGFDLREGFQITPNWGRFKPTPIIQKITKNEGKPIRKSFHPNKLDGNSRSSKKSCYQFIK